MTEKPFFTLEKQELIQIFSSLATLVEDIIIHMDINGISIRTMDPSHVALIDISIDEKSFIDFDTKDQEIDFYLNVNESLKIIKSLDKGKIKCIIKRDHIELIQNGFITQLKNLNIDDSTNCPLPKIHYNSKFVFSKNTEIKQILKKFESNTDYITFEVIDQNLEFSGSSDQGICKMNFTNDDNVQIESTNDSRTKYSLEYINPFLKSINKDNKLIFEYSQNKPLRISQKIGLYGVIHYYLAPKVES